jgi:hypothetical protein
MTTFYWIVPLSTRFTLTPTERPIYCFTPFIHLFHPEAATADGDCNECCNVGTLSTYNTSKPLQVKLHDNSEYQNVFS